MGERVCVRGAGGFRDGVVVEIGDLGGFDADCNILTGATADDLCCMYIRSDMMVSEND